MELVIDRSKWLRGEGGTQSYLMRRYDGKMCCLGFYCLACGLTERQIIDIQSPNTLMIGMNFDRPNLLKDTHGSWLIHTHDTAISKVAADLMDLNDDQRLSEHKREQAITEIFARHDVTVTFV
jgi:hypothetical protein